MRAWLPVLFVAMAAQVAHAGVEDDLRDGDRYFEDSAWAKAAAAYDRAIGKAPGEVSASAYGKRAAIYIIVKDYKGGLAFVEHALARTPNAPEIMEQQALMLWQTDARDKAIEVATKVVAARPQTFTNQSLLGEYYASRDPVKTAAAYEAYLASRPQDLEGGDVLPRIRLGFAYLANARSVLGDGDESHAQQLYSKAAEQFELVQKKFGKKPNAAVNADNGLCAADTGLAKWDQAVTVCERIAAEPKHIDATGSVWFNLGTAYLARAQTKKARAAATEFTKLRKTEARGFVLIGDTYFAERAWQDALDAYLRADKLVRANQQRDAIGLSIKLGKTYRRLPGGDRAKNLELAIDKLASGLAANPGNLELATELGDAYLEARQDGKASALADRIIGSAGFTAAPPDARGALLVIAGKAAFGKHELHDARARFEAAASVRPADISIQRDLVTVINEQAFDADKDAAAAKQLLDQALAVDPNSPTTLTNLALLAIERNDCDGGQKILTKLATIRGADDVLRMRLLGRTYLCQQKPDAAKAAEAFATAEKEAKQANAPLQLAEIYTEWAPLLWDTDLDGAVDKLDAAVTAGGTDPAIGPAARRNLAVALFKRGWKRMRDGHGSDAAADLERALRDPGVLRGTEPLAFELSYALALLDAGRFADAGTRFKTLAAKGNQASYLRGPYAKLGAPLFAAYAAYRGGTISARQQAAAELEKLQREATGGFAETVKQLVAACDEAIAYDQWKAGQTGAASKTLAAADKAASGEVARRVQLDRAALALGKDKLATLESLAGAGGPPEALVDLGIAYELAGRPKDAYEAWTKARARGVRTPELQKWIDAKKRIYGFP
jgi:cytochrome c-type biogenesis protein CcmH/NrfG